MAITKEEYRALRQSINLTMEQMAPKLGVTYPTIFRREKGINPITLEAELAIKEIVRREKQIMKKEKAE